MKLDKNKDIYVFCRTGCRSLCLISMLVKYGYDAKKLYNLDGGILKMKDENDLNGVIIK